MFDIGFWELLVIAVVLLLVMGPEKLPEVAKQAAFLLRKARQGMFRLRSEMQSELDQTPLADLQQARQEMNDFKNDIKQMGRDLANSHEKDINEKLASEPETKRTETDSKAVLKDNSKTADQKKEDVKKDEQS